MADFEINIKTPAELSGAKQALALLEQQIGKAKALGEEMSKIQMLESRAERARKGIADFEKAAAEAGDAAAEAGDTATASFEGFNKELKHNQVFLQAAASSFPGLGLAAAAAFNPATLGAAALGLGLAEIVSQVQAAKKEVEDFMALTPVFFRHADATRGLKAELQALRVELAGFWDDMDRTGRKQESLRKVYESTAAALRDQASAADTSRASQGNLADTLIKLAVARGEITQEAAAALEAQKRLREAEAKATAERIAELEALKAKEDELAAARATLAESETKVPQLIEAQAVDKAALKRLSEDLANAEKVNNPAGEARRTFNDREKAYQDFVASNPSVAAMSPEDRAGRQASLQRELEAMAKDPFMAADPEARLAAEAAARSELSTLSKFQELETHRNKLVESFRLAAEAVATLPAQIEALTIATNARSKDIDAAKTAAQTAKGQVANLPGELDQMRQGFAVNDRRRGEERNIRRQIFELEQPPREPAEPRTADDFYKAQLRRLGEMRGGRADAGAQRDSKIMDLLELTFSRIEQDDRRAKATEQRLEALQQRVNHMRPGSQ